MNESTNVSINPDNDHLKELRNMDDSAKVSFNVSQQSRSENEVEYPTDAIIIVQSIEKLKI